MYILHFQCKRIWILFRAFDPHPYLAPEMLPTCRSGSSQARLWLESRILTRTNNETDHEDLFLSPVTIQTDHWWSLPLSWPLPWTENEISDITKDLKYLMKLNKLVPN